MSPEDVALLLDPPLATRDVPGIGGRIRCRPEDFRVAEIAAYEPDGAEDSHLLLSMTKRGLTSEMALQEVARQLGVSRTELGMAGLKDRDAVTEQRISVPAAAGPGLARFVHDAIELGAPQPHSHKLRRGHLHGNRFEIVVRDLGCSTEEAVARVRGKLAEIQRRGGLDNLYGPQRFGHGGHNIERGLERLVAARRIRRGDLIASAGQSAGFNLTALVRRERGSSRRVLEGDVLKKTATGGLFTSTDSAVDQARLDAGELVGTGPMFGGKTMRPPEGSAAAELEREMLERCGLSEAVLRRLGKRVPGTRRPLQVPIGHATVEPAAPRADLSAGIVLRFELPAGSYATELCREIIAEASPRGD